MRLPLAGYGQLSLLFLFFLFFLFFLDRFTEIATARINQRIIRVVHVLNSVQVL